MRGLRRLAHVGGTEEERQPGSVVSSWLSASGTTCNTAAATLSASAWITPWGSRSLPGAGP